MADNFPKTGQGPATRASDEDLARHNLGYTNPNLHRYLPETPADAELSEDERAAGVVGKSYQLSIAGTDSYRTTTIILHDEESETCEIP